MSMYAFLNNLQVSREIVSIFYNVKVYAEYFGLVTSFIDLNYFPFTSTVGKQSSCKLSFMYKTMTSQVNLTFRNEILTFKKD